MTRWAYIVVAGFLAVPVTGWSQSPLPDAPTPQTKNQPSTSKTSNPAPSPSANDNSTPTNGTKPDDEHYPFPGDAAPRSDSPPANSGKATKPDDEHYPFPGDAPPRSDSGSNSANKPTKPDDAHFPFPGDEPPSSDSNPAGESSSKSNQVDLSPPAGDYLHPGANIPGVTEFHPYDPHRADKDVEVGMFYYKRGNYTAAASRFEEALQWQNNHAEATFRLAQSQEKIGKKADAVESYRQYLKILPKGEFAAEAQKSIQRLAPIANAESNQKAATSPPSGKGP